MSDDPLLQPFQLKHLTLKNRVMSSSHEPAYSEDGMPKERYAAYHAEKARGGMALTMTAGSAVVSPDSPPAFGNLLAYKDEIVPWIERLTDAVHEHDCACMIQITHLGRRAGWGQDDWLPIVAPSRLREPAHRGHPKAAEASDIERIITHYADAAERMKAGGMDGIEIESYGHLFDQFLSPHTNRRDDEWGGSFANRLRFPVAVLRAVRERVGPDFIVGVRMAIEESLPDGLGLPEGLAALQIFSNEGLIDFVNVIRGNIVNDVTLNQVIPVHGMPSAPHLDFTGMVREHTQLPVFHAAKIDDVATARHAVREGKVDMIGMTRAHLADPHIVRKIQLGQESTIRPCVGATYCLDRIYVGGEALCIHNAATGRELQMPHVIAPALVARRIVVVGAGPGGLEAARVSAERGHAVTVLEAMPWAGGQLRLAARNPRRRDLLGIVEWRVAELERLGVDVRYDTFADPAVIAALEPHVVIIATGALPQNPSVESGESLMVNAWDVIGGDASPSGEVILYDDDGNHTAMTAAELLVNSGAHLEIVTPERTVGVEVGGMNMVSYNRALNEADARVTLTRRVRSIARRDDGRLDVELGSDHSGIRHTRVVDAVIGDHGALSNDDLFFELLPASVNLGELDQRAFVDGDQQQLRTRPSGDYQLFRIGDAVEHRNIHAAIYDALRLCKDL
jgi:2,4-dienoyl-CoA reductase-like NADH-dependent reductase (Old Yellow Enzyme family)/thioredoxin reductase